MIRFCFVACLLAVAAAPAAAVDLSISTEPYGFSGLLTDPLIPSQGDMVRITVRAGVVGEAPEKVAAAVTVLAPDGSAQSHTIMLTPEKDPPPDIEGPVLSGSMEWKASANGLYRLRAQLDPTGTLAESDENNNRAESELPVVIPGRRPHFVWYSLPEYLRWATASGNSSAGEAKRWRERGRLPLQWHNGIRKDGLAETEENVLSGYANRMKQRPASLTYGFAVDELGYYPSPRTEKNFRTFLRATQRTKKDNPEKMFLIWHCGSLYPEQASAYRGGCDLVVLESYVFNWGPAGLGLEQAFDWMDMKMLPARQCDLLGPTGKGTQVITSVDLTHDTFHRGMMEAVFRHLRRKWPEMRGIGFFSSCTRGVPKEDREAHARGVANNKWVETIFVLSQIFSKQQSLGQKKQPSIPRIQRDLQALHIRAVVNYRNFLPRFLAHFSDSLEWDIKLHSRPRRVCKAVIIEQNRPSTVEVLKDTDQIIAFRQTRDGGIPKHIAWVVVWLNTVDTAASQLHQSRSQVLDAVVNSFRLFVVACLPPLASDNCAAFRKLDFSLRCPITEV